MLYHNNGITCVRKFLQYLNELLHIIGVQAGGGLIQDIYCLAGAPAGKLCRQLHALCLAAGKGRRRLSDLDIPQPHIVQGLQLALYFWQVLKEGQALFHAHLQYIIDALALIFDLQRLPVIALALAHLAGDIHIRQKVHRDLQNTGALARLAPAALHIKGEPPNLIPPHFGLVGGSKNLPNVIEHPGVGGRVAAGRPPYGALVDINDLIHQLQPMQRLIFAGPHMGPHQLLAQRLVQDLIDQRTFAGTRYTGHRHKASQREFDIDVLEVIFGSAHNLQIAAVAGSA